MAHPVSRLARRTHNVKVRARVSAFHPRVLRETHIRVRRTVLFAEPEACDIANHDEQAVAARTLVLRNHAHRIRASPGIRPSSFRVCVSDDNIRASVQSGAGHGRSGLIGSIT
jgi:hypothetical protein